MSNRRSASMSHKLMLSLGRGQWHAHKTLLLLLLRMGWQTGSDLLLPQLLLRLL